MDGPKQLDEETLQYLYAWIDKIPLSRTKRNISRDFSDGGISFKKQIAANYIRHTKTR